MHCSPLKRPSWGPSALLLALLLAPSAAAQVDPFAPHVRWTHAPTAGTWIPRSLSFAAGGDLLWGAGSVGSPRLLLLSSNELPAETAGEPLLDEDLGLAGAVGTLIVRAGSDPTALFSVHQVPGSAPSTRHTFVERRSVGAGGTLSLTWSRELALVGNGAPALALDGTGTSLVCAVSDVLTGTLELEWLAAVDGALLTARTLTGGTLRALELSHDGETVALLSGAQLLVLDSQGVIVHQETLALATNALALSSDGDHLLVGAGTFARLLTRTASGFADSFSTPSVLGEVVTRVALSEDGEIAALGWWDQVSGTGVRLQVWETTTDSLVFEQSQTAPGASLQNFPEAVAMTPDGRRVAFGVWGVGDSAPELLLVDVPTGAIVLQADLPGSVRALALDPTGTRVAVGMKHSHANQFATTGEVRLHDTGERDLQLLSGPVGDTLRLATRQAGAGRSLFVFGTLSPAPTAFRSALGSLWIQRSAPLRVYNRAADMTGRSDLTVSRSSVAGQVGASFAVQVAARVSGSLHFTATVLEPLDL